MKPFLTLVCILLMSIASAQKVDTLRLTDNARQRNIPVAFYSGPSSGGRPRPVVVISHGYNNNRPGSYLHYSKLANFLAAKGFFVVSIQHELPTDSLLPTAGKPRETRWTNWERGAENIRFVLQVLRRLKPENDYRHVSLIGHSNGGDMSVLFAHRYGNEVEKVITLDHRRMDFPRRDRPAFLTLRSSEFQADEGVLPTDEEIKTANIKMKIIQLKDVKHHELSDDGTEAQLAEINNYVLDFLQQ